MAEEGDRLNAAERDRIRADLVERKRRLAETQRRLQGEAAAQNPRELGDTSSVPQHLGDLGSETYEQDKDLGLAERTSKEISGIDAALERLEAGTYGTCETCGGPIPEERLRALPSATRCAGCQTRQEAA